MAIVLLLSLFSVLPAQAQKGFWTSQLVTKLGLDKGRPEVAIDAWGNIHVVWTMQDPKRSGLQLFYDNDATGRFSSPYQVTDTGTVFDSAGQFINPYVFHLDSSGIAHIAYVAHVQNHLQLYYTSNAKGEFSASRFLTQSDERWYDIWYDMAVDSVGVAHVVWIKTDGSQVSLYYWNSATPDALPEVIALGACTSSTGFGCQVGNPEIEVWNGTLHVAYRTYRSDAAMIYYLQKHGDTNTVDEIDLPRYDRASMQTGNVDLRLKMALDGFGFLHIVAPQYDQIARNTLFYISNSSGKFLVGTLAAGADTSRFSDFDIASDGDRHLAVSWTRASGATGLNELMIGPSTGWTAQSLGMTSRLNNLVAVPPTYECSAVRVAYRNGKIVIVGLAPIATETARFQVGLYTRTSTHPDLSYLLPDAGAPGMSVVVDGVAPFRAHGSFGIDGFHRDTVAMELLDPADNARVVVGPSVVSWDGRLISTTLFIKPGATPGPVPVRIRVDTAYTAIDTFFVMLPQSLGDSTHHLRGGGVLGSGGSLGVRSKRGVMIVDSLVLDSGTYMFDTTDVDASLPGNQGALPVTILSSGPIKIGVDARLSVSAHNDSAHAIYGNAGPGGGGGGSGGEVEGGMGFTGGGGPGWLNHAKITGSSAGSGGVTSGRWTGGPGLNGVPGGAAYGRSYYPSASSGGGTGHPFGASGGHGQISAKEPSSINIGSFGGGSGGAAAAPDLSSVSAGGGGGGNGAPGGSGFPTGESNGGAVVGSPSLVPMAGGSGGGGGGYSIAGLANGGGGGGALALIAYGDLTVDGDLLANGGDGARGQSALNGSGGGGGAGGSIYIAARGGIALSTVSRVLALGGAGGGSTNGNPGGDGGFGRVRIDGKISSSPSARVSPASGYSGPSTFGTASVSAVDGAVISGYGLPGHTVRVYTRVEGGIWSYNAPKDVTVGSDSSWRLNLGPVGGTAHVYVAVLQKTDNPSRNEFLYEPAWVMSPSSGVILGHPKIQFTADSLHFDCIPFDSCVTADLYVSNTGEITNLIVNGSSMGGPNPRSFAVTALPGEVAPSQSKPIRVQFCPGDTGQFAARITLKTNAFPDSTRTVTVSGCAISGILSAKEIDLDLGEICIGDCRDTTIHLTNTGQAPLRVNDVSGDIQDISIFSYTKLPFVIQPGETHDLTLHLCLNRFNSSGTRLKISTNSIDSLYTRIVVKGTNAGPNADFNGTLEFGAIDLSTEDSCQVKNVTVRNKSATAPLRIRLSAPATRRYSLLLPTETDLTIPPLGSLDIPVKLCGDTLGEFYDSFGLMLGGNRCAIDTVVTLHGIASATSPQLVIVDPAPKSLTFPSTPVATLSGEQTITIRNRGRAPGIVASIVGYGRNGTTDGEILVDLRGITLPDTLQPNAELTIGVRVQPASQGDLAGVVVAVDDRNAWSDSVSLIGRGVMPGIQVDLPAVEFDDTRVGGSSPSRLIRVLNSGTLPAVIDNILVGDPNQFRPVPGNSISYPVTLAPGDELRLWYYFQPNAERNASDVLKIMDESGINPTVQLHGRGVLEHVVSAPARLDFGCLPLGHDSIAAFTVNNTGTYPLTIGNILVATGADQFAVIDGLFPDMVPVGESRTYHVRYTARTGNESAHIQILSSAPESTAVDAIGDICTEITGFALSVPDAGGRVGSSVVLPVNIRIDRPPVGPIPYSFTLTYDYQLLAPRDGGSGSYPLDVSGSVSTAASMTHVRGEVMVVGTMGRVSDTLTHLLVGIPMEVLIGPRFDGVMDFSDAQFSLVGAKITAMGGTFTAQACDTGGGIQIYGKYSLGQNYPNPSKPTATIQYEIAMRDHVVLNLYDANGAFMRALIDEVEDAGSHTYVLETATLPAGVYTYELISGRYRMTKRMVIVN